MGSKRAECLVAADIRGRFLPPDMLLARLEGQNEPFTAFSIDGTADDPARHFPDQIFPCCNETEVGAPERKGNAQRLTSPVAISTPISPGVFKSAMAIGYTD